MTAELGDWLTELGESNPATAAEVAAALVAVLRAAEPSGLTIVGTTSAPHSPDPREAADDAYQQLLEGLQQVRRSVADVASSRKRASLRLDAERAAGTDSARLAVLERDVIAVRESEAELTEQSLRLQWKVDAFRAAKESAKAMYTAAEAQLRIAEALEGLGAEPEASLVQLREDLQTAENNLRALQSGVLADEIRSWPTIDGTERREHAKSPPNPRRDAEPAPGVLELRADPLGSDIRILLAVEPADTVTLLAVLEGADAVSEYGAEAIRLAGDLLAEVREDGWPADIDEVAFEGASAFLARFFPDDGGTLRRRAGPVNEG